MKDKKLEKYLLSDDTFAFFLQLINYPLSRESVKYFSDFTSSRYKKLGKDELLIFLVFLKTYYGVILDKPLDEKATLWNLSNNYSVLQLRRFFKQKNVKQVEEIFYDIDFRIIVPKETVAILEKSNEEYIRDFIKDHLIKWERNIMPFEKQKELMIEKIKDAFKCNGPNLIFFDSEIDPRCKFFEIMFALEKLNFLKIKHILNIEDNSEKYFYKIVFFVNKDKFLDESRKTPTCHSKDGIGFLRINKDEIKISKKSSQPYKLLSFLISPFGKARSIDSAFAVIQTGRSKKAVENSGLYLKMNEKIKSLKMVNKELQKIKAYTERLKINFDEERKYVWIDYKK